jgi:hypothetical protein
MAWFCSQNKPINNGTEKAKDGGSPLLSTVTNSLPRYILNYMNSDKGEVMDKSRTKVSISLKRILIIAIPLAIGATVLVACGGGGTSQPPTKDTAAAATGTTATGTDAKPLAAVPPGWVPRGYQVINGITVPPEPDATVNNSTLAGVDINKNGVRDDVERVIAKKVTSSSEFANAIDAARAYQSALISGFLSQSDAEAYMLRLHCDARKTHPGLQTGDIQNLTLNTPDRNKTFILNGSKFGGTVINIRTICN